MNTIGHYFDREVFWLESSEQFPDENWVCLAIADNEIDEKKFELFVRNSISKGILEFKSYGKFSARLHHLFDLTMIDMETLENHKEISVVTTWHTEESLADVFWQCFFATCLPETADYSNIKIACIDFDGNDRREELKNYLKEFDLGWLPSENFKHEVWKDPEGLTTLCLGDERGDNSRKLLEPNSKLIHTIYASSHFEAMTKYYKYMNWGEYETEFEIDKKPYKKNAT